MSSLKGSRTEENLKQALIANAQASERFHLCARDAYQQGEDDTAQLLRATAEAEMSRAAGHLRYLEPAAEAEDTRTMIASLALMNEHAAMYPAMARTARLEGFDDVADWFETLAKATRRQQDRLHRVRGAARSFQAEHVSTAGDHA